MITTGRPFYAWRLLLLVPLVGALIAVKGLITGSPSNPALVQTLIGLNWEELRAQQPGVAMLISVMKRHESLALLGWSFWLAWTNIHSTSSPSRWVWYGWWTVPVVLAAIKFAGAGVRSGMSFVLVGVIGFTMICLFVSRRVFRAAGRATGAS